jgi:hypothetical protein
MLDVKDQLLKQSIGAAQRAIRHYLVPEYDQFLIQAGHSFELLGKARLAAIHPNRLGISHTKQIRLDNLFL